MTEIWDEKPGSDVVQLIWDDPTAETNARVYNADLMDAWLERLRERHFKIMGGDMRAVMKSNLSKENFHLLSDKLMAESKLEAVKTIRNELYEALPTGSVDAFDLIKAINNHITELDKVLESSEFTTKGDNDE